MKRWSEQPMIGRILCATVLALLGATPCVRAQCEGWMAGPLSLPQNGADDSIGAATVWDPDGAGPAAPVVVVGGSFTSIGGVPANRVAAWNGSYWSALGDGLPGQVLDLVVHNGNLVACGQFAGTVWQWQQGAWISLQANPIGYGSDSAVIALGVYNGELIIGGSFTSLSGVTAPCIARRSGNAWHPLGPGMTGAAGTGFPRVSVLGTFNGELIAGGHFETIGTLTNVNNIAKWNGSAWSTMGTGVTGSLGQFRPEVYALRVFGGALIVGGEFTTAGGIPASAMARWTGSTWQAIAGSPANGIFSAAVYALTEYAGALIVGGWYTTTGGGAATNMARWNGATWTALGAGLSDGAVYALAVHGGELIAGGTFRKSSTVPMHRVARWPGGAPWEAFIAPRTVYAMTTLGSRVVIAGDLVQGPQPASAHPVLYHVAGWDGDSFSAFGAGFNAPARALESFTQTSFPFGRELICGGDFTLADGVSANRVARWVESNVAFPPPAWEPMGAGFNGTVHALERFNNATYAGGVFTMSGAGPAAGIARWDGAAWQQVGSGVNGAVYALRAGAVQPNSIELIAGGGFTLAGGAPANRIARWTQNPLVPGSGAWSAMGAGFDSIVRAVERHGGSTYAGGDFTASGAVTLNRIARWTGSAWAPVGTGFNGTVNALKSYNGHLYAAGTFLTAGGVAASRVARWDGASWSPVMGGADGTVYALHEFQGELQTGGLLANVSNPAITSPGWARYTATGAPWVGLQPQSITRICGHQAVFTVAEAPGYTGITYQWRKNGVNLIDGPTGTGSVITGATAYWLSITSTGTLDQGSYDCVLSSACGGATSSAGVLTLTGCCYPDCNGDGALNLADFGCFQTKFALQDPYADCNGDGALNLADFGCFQTKFALGCP